MDRRRATGVALVLVSAAAFGSGSLFAQPVYAAGVGWLTLSAWRFLFGAGFTWCFLLLSADRRGARAGRPVRRQLGHVLRLARDRLAVTGRARGLSLPGHRRRALAPL